MGWNLHIYEILGTWNGQYLFKFSDIPLIGINQSEMFQRFS